MEFCLHECVRLIAKQSQVPSFSGPLSLQVHDQMVEIFDHPDVVMTTFVQAVIDRVLLVGTCLFLEKFNVTESVCLPS